jgi:thioredoxin-like negative regulator of GroEL
MGKLIKFESDADAYFDRAVDAAEDGSFMSALHYARRAAKLDSYSTDALMLIAEIYTEMGLFYPAINQYFKTLALDEDAFECYMAIGQNFYLMDANIAALKYLKRGIDGAWDAEYLSQARSVLESIGTEKKFRLVGGGNGSNNEIILNLSRSLFADGEYSHAINLLNFVPEKSENYPEALLQKALCTRHLKDFEGSRKYTEELLARDGNDIHALCNKAKLYLETKEIEKAAEILDYLAETQTTDRGELYGLAVTMLDANRDADALNFLEKFADREPYELNVLILLGQVYYNLKKSDKAQECFLAVLAIDEGNLIAKYYNRYIQEARKSKKPRLKYILQLPLAEANRILRKLITATDKSPAEFREAVLGDRGFFDEARWLYGVNRHEAADRLNIRLAALSDKRVTEFLRVQLSDMKVPNIVKKSIFTAMLREGKVKRLALVIDDDIRFFACSRPKSLAEAPQAVIDAYCIVFAALAFIGEGFENRLKTVVSKFMKTHANKLAEFSDINALACALALTSGEKDFGDIAVLTKIFDADTKIVRKYLKK